MYCTDQKGIIAAVTNFMHHKEGNITYIDQYVDRPNGAFFMRIESDFIGNSFDLEKFKKSFNDEIGNRFSLNCNFYLKSQKPRMAVFVSKYDHCLYDILAKQQSGELAAEITIKLFYDVGDDGEGIYKFNFNSFTNTIYKSISHLAERKGFEPSIPMQLEYTLSRRAPSTTRPPL